MKENFFAKIGNTKPYFKANFYGFAGSGKTYTAAMAAIGLHQKIKSTKPIVFFDTEKAVKFLKQFFDARKIEVLVRESRTLADLKETMRQLRENGIADILIIDSISHVWEDTLEAYKRRVNRQSLQFQDWGTLKPTWKKEFSDPFVVDPYHVIMCGRAGYEYDFEKNPDTGKRELQKTGIKEKVEGETAYEPDLLVLMERYQEMLNGTVEKVVRTATIIKDRSTVIDGKVFENPTFKDFEPAVDVMLENPVKPITQTEADSATLFKVEEDKQSYLRERDKALEEIEGYLTSVWPGQAAKDKKAKVEAVNYAFSTFSWTAVKGMSPEKLRQGMEKIKEFATQEV